jgi:hypothetical protein
LKSSVLSVSSVSLYFCPCISHSKVPFTIYS